MDMYGMEFLSFFSVSCGTPSLAGRVDLELFNSTTVGSEIVYTSVSQGFYQREG